MAKAKPIVLLILDGWGYRAERADNAIALANLPNWHALLNNYPHSLIHTEGKFVGLPDGQMGNSEVGHMNIGAGRIVYQDLTRIDAAIEDGSFIHNPIFLDAMTAVKANGKCLHVMGLLSPGGVHSHEQHIFALLRLAKQQGVSRVQVHAFLDGRDMPPQSAEPSLQRLQALCDELGQTRIASVIGRYYAMDRDQRWDRMQSAYQALTFAQADFHADSAADALSQAYARGETDEFVKATVLDNAHAMQDGDAIVFMNFRADRARQLAACYVSDSFSGFDVSKRPAFSRFVCLSEYDATLKTTIAYASETLHNTLADVLADRGLQQLRIAETEKYAHVTFFFNGGVELPVIGEQRMLIPSPKVATYDMQPEMSCPELTEKLTQAIASAQFDVIICNIANPDMVGHTGSLSAAIEAAEAVDTAIGKVCSAVLSVGGELLVTADHGNVEMMRDPITGEPHTSHTVGPVYFVYMGRTATVRNGGALRDIAPTILNLLGIAKPIEMTGQSLVELNA